MALVPSEIERGQCESTVDIESGVPKLFWQTRGSWGELLTRLMAERFGVSVQHISDITSWAEKSYRQGYNDTISAHVDKIFGEGSFQAVLDEVHEYRLRQYQRYLTARKTGNA